MADNIDVTAGSGTTIRTTDNAGVHTPHHNVDTMPGTAAEGAALPSAFVVVAGDDGTDTHPLQVNATGELKVAPNGDVAHDAADSGNPVKIGGKANAAAPTSVGENDRVNASFDLAGRLRVLLESHPALAAGEAHVGQVGGHTARPSATFNRPADTTAYASGDLVANSTTAGSVTPMQITVARVAAGSGVIRRCRIRKSGTSVTNASFRLHLYRASPTPSNGDNGAWLTDQSANYIGAFDVTVDRAFTDGSAGNGLPLNGGEIAFALSSGQIVYGLLEARAAYTPSSGETFVVELEVLQD